MIKFIRFIFFPLLMLLIPVYFFVFCIIMFINKKAQKRFNNLKIVCVGNHTLGGSGKTEIVKKIAQDLKELSKPVAIITRGYKGKTKNEPFFLSLKENHDNRLVKIIGDEAYMLYDKLKVPIVICKNRKKSLEFISKEFSSCIVISDDGYQNFSFFKDVNILVINLVDFKKFQFLFPSGNLREPFSLALKRANYVVLNHRKFVSEKIVDKIKKKIKKINKKVLFITTDYKINSFVNIYSKKRFSLVEFLSLYNRIILCCGIGNPLILKRMLEIEGFDIEKKFIYPDHYWYKLKNINKLAKNFKLPVVVTYKDAVKLLYYLGKISKVFLEKFYYIDIELEIVEGKDIWKNIINTL
ncbi:MAG: tetraacyldisaccharide 4'-kinase [Endomicrobiia bacterium]